MVESDLRTQLDSTIEGDTSDGRIPLVLLGGFLGAGKTTVLNHILSQAKGSRIAALVNDVGAVNIDAALTRDLACVDSRSTDGIVELSNGCICCGIQGAFGEAVIGLAQQNPDYILVEATGIAEPKGIIASLEAENEDGVSASDFVRIVNVVTVVDAKWWVEKVEEAYSPVRRSFLLLSDPRRPLSELLTMQVEYSNVIVLNKTDLADEERLRRSQAALSAINPTAEIVLTCEGKVEVAELLEVERFDLSATFQGSQYNVALAGGAKADEGGIHGHGDFGLTAFVYESRRPMKYEKLIAFLRGRIPGLLRAKGFTWTDRELDRIGYFSLAGESLRFDHLGKWMHALVRDGDMDRSRIPGAAWKKWDPKTGDRRQEIVFIGVDLDREKIEKALDGFRLDELESE